MLALLLQITSGSLVVVFQVGSEHLVPSVLAPCTDQGHGQVVGGTDFVDIEFLNSAHISAANW